jgi:Flp pilus assembly protein TadG
MTRQVHILRRETGVALVHMAITLTVLILFAGLAADTGRAYVVKAQLSKAVDGAALGAARNLNSGNPRGEAEKIFNANFPIGFMGTTTVTDPTTDPNFFALTTDPTTGVNIVTINATAVMPTSFMRLGGQYDVTVSSSGEATRRMVDLSLVLDVSSSIGWRWPYVRDAARSFVNAFDAAHDRISLVLFGNGANVIDAMPATRGFNKSLVMADMPNSLPGGSTAMVQGLYRGWDEVRSVPNGQQSGLRVIVLFTDGASNSVPAIYPGAAVTSTGLRTWDFPKNLPDPDGQTHNSPQINGFYHTQSGASSPGIPALTLPWNSTTTHMSAQYLPTMSTISERRSAGIPFQFPLQSSTLYVNGSLQSAVRGLRNFNSGVGQYPAEIFNINNAARNLVEIIADAARSDAGGDYPIRIYTIGMGELVRYMLGTMPEMPEDILKRMANDPSSMDHNSMQLDGKYYFAQTPSDVGPAFAALQNQILRLTK